MRPENPPMAKELQRISGQKQIHSQFHDLSPLKFSLTRGCVAGAKIWIEAEFR
jgi:hypothetical protein